MVLAGLVVLFIAFGGCVYYNSLDKNEIIVPNEENSFYISRFNTLVKTNKHLVKIEENKNNVVFFTKGNNKIIISRSILNNEKIQNYFVNLWNSEGCTINI